jgi:hypothetical protein
MRIPQELKLFFAILLSTGFIFCFSHIGALAVDSLFYSNSQYGDNTKIGSIDISGLNDKEALSLIMEKQKAWADKTTIQIVFKEKSAELKLDVFTFDIEQSLKAAESNEQKELIVQINEEKFDSFLSEFASSLLTENPLDKDKFYADILSYASMLEAGNHIIHLDKYYENNQKSAVISEASIALGENESQLDTWVEQFPSIEIKPQSTFSMLKMLEDSGVEDYSNETLGMLSSSIYKTIIQTNFLITERHISRELPSYVEVGFEVNVNPSNNMDFVFTNINEQAYSLNFKIIDHLFYVTLNGPEFLYSYKIVQKDKEAFPPKTIIQYDAKLPFNSERIQQEGKEGIIIKVFREKLDENGVSIDMTQLSEDFYPPVNRVVVLSLLSKKSTTPNTNTVIQPSSNGESTNKIENESPNLEVESKEEKSPGELWDNPDEVLK